MNPIHFRWILHVSGGAERLEWFCGVKIQIKVFILIIITLIIFFVACVCVWGGVVVVVKNVVFQVTIQVLNEKPKTCMP